MEKKAPIDLDRDITVVTNESTPLINIANRANTHDEISFLMKQNEVPQTIAKKYLSCCTNRNKERILHCCDHLVLLACCCFCYEHHHPLGYICPDTNPEQREQNVGYCLVGATSASILWACCLFS